MALNARGGRTQRLFVDTGADTAEIKIVDGPPMETALKGLGLLVEVDTDTKQVCGVVERRFYLRTPLNHPQTRDSLGRWDA